MVLVLIGCPDGDYCDICNDDEKEVSEIWTRL